MLLIFDENFPPQLAKGFASLEEGNRRSPIKIQVAFSVDYMGGPRYNQQTGERIGIMDEEIIEKASLQEAIIVTHDDDFKRIKHYKPLLVKHKVGYIYFRTPKKYNYWEMVKAFVNSWEKIKEQISQSEHPFAFEISKDGHIKRLEF